MADDDKRQRTAGRGRSTIFTFALWVIMVLPVWIFITLVISIIIEWVGMFVFFDGVGASHSRTMVISEAQYINDTFRDTQLGEILLKVAGHAVEGFNGVALDSLNGLHVIRMADENMNWLQAMVAASIFIAQVFVLRLIVFVFSLPAFFLFALVGAVNGLAYRDVRRFLADTESESRFVIYYRLSVITVPACFFIYVAWPDQINPTLIIIPFAVAFGFFLQRAISNFRKFL